MNKPILTIITVCFNAAATIEETLNSVAYRPSNVEYIVIDGNSTDSTLNVLQGRLNIIDCLISEPDNGIFDAMSKGAQAARGQFITFLNADDYYLPGALERLVQHLLQTEAVDVYCADWIGVDKEGKEHLRTAEPYFAGRHNLCHQAIAARKSIFPIPAFDPKYKLCADFDQLLRWQQEKRKFKRLEFPLVRFSEIGASARFLKRSASESITVALRRGTFPWAQLFAMRMALYYLRSVTR